MKTVFVSGTWGFKFDTPTVPDWWNPKSSFAREAIAHGVDLADYARPFVWDGNIDGLDGMNQVWRAAGFALCDYAAARGLQRVNVVAHSHGCQVVAYAAYSGLKIENLITVAGPIRDEIQIVWERSRKNIAHWSHLHGGYRDIWQVLGELGQGRIFSLIRGQALADENLCEPKLNHRELLEPSLWTARGFWTRIAAPNQRDVFT